MGLLSFVGSVVSGVCNVIKSVGSLATKAAVFIVMVATLDCRRDSSASNDSFGVKGD